MQTGWRPNSIKIGDNWVDYSSIQPIALPIMAVANFAEAAREIGKQGRDATLSEMAGQLLLRTTNSILNQSFLQGLSVLFEAMSSHEPISVNKLIAGHVQQFVPFSGALRTVAQATDPVIRAPEGITESIKSIVPGLSNEIEPLLDPYGRPTRRVGNPWLGGFLQASPEVNDPVTNLLLASGVPLARPSGRLEDSKGDAIALSRSEATALAMARGATRREALERAARRSEGKEFDRVVTLFEKAKQEGSQNITQRARLAKKRGESLAPQRLVTKKLVDELYNEYLASARR